MSASMKRQMESGNGGEDRQTTEKEARYKEEKTEREIHKNGQK